MKDLLNCILLVDDDFDDNFVHRRIIRKLNVSEHIAITNDGEEALAYLRAAYDNQPGYYRPEIILLDINMPKMDGWEFLEAYAQLEKDLHADHVIAMLTTSLNPDDHHRAMTNPNVRSYQTKPLTETKIRSMINEFFPEKL